MKRNKAICAVGLVVLLAVPIQAQVSIPNPLPTIDFDFTPVTPTSDDTVSLRISGTWPNSCVPESGSAVVDGTSIVVSMLLPGALDCDEPVCQPVLSAYELNVDVGPLAPGEYAVLVQVVECDETSPTEFIGSFTVVGLPAGGPAAPDPIEPGTCVILLQDTDTLRAGQAGVVVCCDPEDCGGRVLVSWFLFMQGDATEDDCTDATPRALPPRSTTWVDRRAVPLGVCFEQCGVLALSPEGCILLEADNGLTYNLFDGVWLAGAIGPGQEFDYGDRVRVQGVLNSVRPADAVFTCVEQAGDIYSPVLAPCAPAGAPNGNGNGNGADCPGDNLTINLGSSGVLLRRDSNCPDDARTFSKCVLVAVGVDSPASLSLEIIPDPAVNGAWHGTITPDVVPAGESNVLVCITVEGVDLTTIPADQDIKVAEVSIQAVAVEEPVVN